MRRVGQTRRRDSNEAAIVKALEALGAQVTRISGKGAPDVLVRFKGTLHGLEIKSAKGRQTEAQLATDWPIIRSVEEALAVIGVQR